MIDCIIIDDEPLARMLIKEYLQSYTDIKIIDECTNGFEAIKAINQHKPQLIFLDIQMPKINGFEMLELVDDPPSVIFTTAFEEYAIKAFEIHAVDYLLKPFSKERFDNAINQFLKDQSKEKKNVSLFLDSFNRLAEEKNRVLVKEGNEIRIIPAHEIIYIEACDDYVKIHTLDKNYMKKKTMTSFEQNLNSSEFIRVHRSFIIQLAQISKIELADKDSQIAHLKNGKKIPLSKSGYAKLKEVLGV